MGNASKAGKNVGIYIGIWTVMLCMLAGLIFKMRPLVIIERSAICFGASLMLGYILVSAIERISSVKKRVVDKAETQEESPGSQELDEAAADIQDDQMVGETEE